MVKTYRTAQQWDHWLSHYFGLSLLEMEERFLSKWLAERYGNHALIIGVPKQYMLLKSCAIANHTLLSPLATKNKYIKHIESAYYNLPIIPGSIDVVLIPHTLECIENPQLLLTEACRVVKPEGDIIIFGFNPISLWGLYKRFKNIKQMPWILHFNHAAAIKKWLELADFVLIEHKQFLFRPPCSESIYNKIKFLDWVGEVCHLPFGAVYVLIAKAKAIPLTPIKWRWNQSISRVSVTYPGPQ